MLEQIADLQADATDLHDLLLGRDERDFARVTQFKGWTINDVILHLHASDLMALSAATNPDGFQVLMAGIKAKRAGGMPLIEENRERVGPLAGRALLDRWWSMLDELCDVLAKKDPETRLKWAGPDMGVRMFTTARQMEVWAHGQEVYDILGVERLATDRLKSIAVIGVRTYGWTFANRGLPTPGEPPHVRLSAPSGGLWEFNPPSETNLVEGSALAFCQTVTQVRNAADTELRVVGGPAEAWMAIAQCFAGPPNDPPKPGTRFRVTSA